MRAPAKSFAVLAALVAVVLAVLGRQRNAAAGLRSEIARQGNQARELAQLQAENQRLAAGQPTAAQLETALAERAAVTQLRTELAAMQRRAAEATRAAPRPAATTPPAPTPLSLKQGVLGFQLWKNAGQATPDAAFETVLWAAAGGDIDTLAGLLAFDPEARNEAGALFGRLPEAVRREFATPERLVAVLTAKDVPLGSANITGEYPTPDDTKVAAQIFDAEGKHKVATFSLRADGDHWRLVVPAQAVRNYSTWLRTPLATAKAAD